MIFLWVDTNKISVSVTIHTRSFSLVEFRPHKHLFWLICTAISKLIVNLDFSFGVNRGRYPLVSSGRVRHLMDSWKLVVRFESRVSCNRVYSSCRVEERASERESERASTGNVGGRGVEEGV